LTIVSNENKYDTALEKTLSKYLSSFNSLYQLEIDTKSNKSNFTISKNQKDKLGFETYLNIRNLSEAKHLLTIMCPSRKDDEKQ